VQQIHLSALKNLNEIYTKFALLFREANSREGGLHLFEFQMKNKLKKVYKNCKVLMIPFCIQILFIVVKKKADIEKQLCKLPLTIVFAANRSGGQGQRGRPKSSSQWYKGFKGTTYPKVAIMSTSSEMYVKFR